MPATTAATGSTRWNQGAALTNTASVKNISFEMKPLSSGTPAMAAPATMVSVAVTGM